MVARRPQRTTAKYTEDVRWCFHLPHLSDNRLPRTVLGWADGNLDPARDCVSFCQVMAQPPSPMLDVRRPPSTHCVSVRQPKPEMDTPKPHTSAGRRPGDVRGGEQSKVKLISG